MVPKTRELVYGKYITSSIYYLFKEDGSIYRQIVEGVPFTIGKDTNPWIPVKEKYKKNKAKKRKNKNRKERTILVCYKYDERGKIIDRFTLIHKQKGLWALTAESAKNGVFHKYRAPQNEIESQLRLMNLGLKILEVKPTIDCEIKLGGNCKNTFGPNNWGWDCITDGKIERLTEPLYEPLDAFNKHSSSVPAVLIAPFKVRVSDATYLIYYEFRRSKYY